jgi:hypothetical protein
VVSRLLRSICSSDPRVFLGAAVRVCEFGSILLLCRVENTGRGFLGRLLIVLESSRHNRATSQSTAVHNFPYNYAPESTIRISALLSQVQHNTR